MIKYLYRISENTKLKNKLGHADKIYCLKNFISCFGKEDLIVFADKCSDAFYLELKEINDISVKRINEGNAGSWRFAASYAMENFSPDTYVYFVEDDYLHLKESKRILLEGLEVGDYVTLFDNPDKYINHKDGGNPLVKLGGEETIVYLTKSSHWKLTNSTTMTFATRVSTLIEDKRIWWKYKSEWPYDFEAFQAITGQKNWLSQIKKPRRKLISAIPGCATHTELKYLSPLNNWSDV